MKLLRIPRSFRFRVLAATSLVAGAVGTIIDSSGQNDCADSMTWLGYVGWALVAGGTLASFGPTVVEQPAARRSARVPETVAVVALIVCLTLAVLRLALRSLCGIELNL